MHRAHSPAPEPSGLVLTRRDLFTLLGSAAVLVACGGKTHTTSPITVGSGTPASTAANSTTTSSSAPAPTNGGGAWPQQPRWAMKPSARSCVHRTSTLRRCSPAVRSEITNWSQRFDELIGEYQSLSKPRA